MKAIYNCDNHNFPEWIKENSSADEIIFRGVMPFEEACAINPIVDCLKGKIVDITDYDISYPVDDDPCANFEEFFFGYIYWSSYYDMLWTVICANKQFATRYVMSLDKPYVLSEDGRVYLQYKLFSSIVIPSSVRVIGHFSFYHIDDADECNIVLPDQLEIVGDLALNGLSQIDSLPDSIREIGAYAFEHVMEYKHFSIPSHIKVIPEGCFRSSEVGLLDETIIVPEGVEKIEFNAFELHSDSRIHFPSTLKDLDTCFHYNEPVYPNEPPYIEVDERNSYFYAVDGTLYIRGEDAPYLGVKYKRYEKD